VSSKNTGSSRQTAVGRTEPKQSNLDLNFLNNVILISSSCLVR